ncbi:MAG: poly(A) polymerase [Bacteroidetes bacterium]|jgi:predicted kinase|nr:poly(A) polymerase [Bacteroidota bacterium]
MWTLSKNKKWEELRKYPWVEDMHGVPQSPIHHAEGDVAVHTQMVLSELEKLSEYQALTDLQKEILWTSALMHDIEKRSTTSIDESGNIVSPGHAKKGALTTRQILYRDFNAPFEIREAIVGLVRYHGLPLWVFEKPDPVQALLKASLEVDTELLVLLAKADVLGRICSDQQELLYKIDMFKELCIEQHCWGQQKQFPGELAKFLFFRKENQSPDYVPFDTTKAEVIILSGIAGSGKDHYIRKHLPDYTVISLDDMRRKLKIRHGDEKGNGRVIQEAKEQARECLRNGKAFVWNATNITAQMRGQLIDLFAVYDPMIRIVYLEVPYKMLIAQNKNREFPIPVAAIERMIDKLEVPKAWEAHKVEYVVL